MGVTSKAEWEKAAHLEGLTLVPAPECDHCSGEGVVLIELGRPGECGACRGEYRYECPSSREEYVATEMAWTRVRGEVVSVPSQIACEQCGEVPRLLGSDVCADCLESAPTLRDAAVLSVVDGAMDRLFGGAS